MADLTIQGKIIQVLEPQGGTSRAGNAWRKQEYVLETADNYPKKVCFHFFGDRIDQNPLQIGDFITLYFDIESREYNGRWYTDIRGWRAEKTQPGAPVPGQQAAPGLIFVCAGTNDAWFRAKRPGLYSETVEQAYARPMTTATKPSEATSLAASARLTLMLLREAFPQAKIIVVTSPYCVQAPNAEIDRVAETLQQCAALSGVYCTRTERTSGIDPVKEQTKKELTVDGVHTSENGAWQLANCVYNFMAFNNLLN